MTVPTAPLWSLATCNDETLPDSTAPGYEFNYVDIGNVSREGGIDAPQRMSFVDAPSRARRILREADVIISTVRTYLRAATAVPKSADGDIASTGFAVLRARSTTNPRFLAHVVLDPLFVDRVVQHSVGVSYPAISSAALLKLRVAHPSVAAQARIADHLDREAARIDEAHGACRAALTGLHGAVAEWLRSQPEYITADSVPLKRLLSRLSDGPFGSALASAHYSDEPSGVRVIRLGNIGTGNFKLRDEAFVPREYGFGPLRPWLLTEGDVVLAALGDDHHPLGRAAVVPASILPAVNKADCYRLVPDKSVCVPEYLAWSLSHGVSSDYAPLVGRGATRLRLTTETAREIPVPLPTLSDQLSLLARLRVFRGSADATADLVDATARLLAEYREALIHEAVTGKLHVPRVSESQMDERLHAATEDRLDEVPA